MANLVLVSFLWAFSFSLIGVYLSGHVDVYVAIVSRLLLAFLVLFPFTKFKSVSFKIARNIMALGAVQIGFMYIAFYKSFLFLEVPEVLLLTAFTPIYVTLIYDLLQKRFHPLFLLTSVLAVAGALLLRWHDLSGDFLIGMLLVQIANICFAAGQVGYKRLLASDEYMNSSPKKDYQAFSYFFLGALIVTLPALFLWADMERLPKTVPQIGVLLWLGVVASGLGYLLWNTSSKKVSSGTLAVMNNLVIPFGLIVNLTLWNRHYPLGKLALGGGLILLALAINQNFVSKSESLN